MGLLAYIVKSVAGIDLQVLGSDLQLIGDASSFTTSGLTCLQAQDHGKMKVKMIGNAELFFFGPRNRFV